MTDVLKSAIAACKKASLFANPAITSVTYEAKGKAAGEVSLPKGVMHPALPDELESMVEQKSEGVGKKAKLSLLIKQALDEAQTTTLKEAYGQNDAMNKAIDKALKSMKTGDEATAKDHLNDPDGD
jgi:hypothetical protein